MSTNSSQEPLKRLGNEPESVIELHGNPYAVTQSVPSDSSIPHSNGAPTSFVSTVLVWTVVCSLSAAPSYFWAISEVAKNQAIAMILGVAIFIGIYSAADIFSRNMPFRQNARMRSILRATFMVRSVMVVIFPVALTTDLFLGMISVNFVALLARPFQPDMGREMNFGIALATTLVQGGLLSVFLFLLGLLISAIVFLIRSLASRLDF